MLSNAQRDLIKATVPLLESGGEALTTHFYRMMLSEFPEVRPLFNQAHQASGDQPRALANGVLMYAKHIDRLEALGPLVAQIVNKHVSLVNTMSEEKLDEDRAHRELRARAMQRRIAIEAMASEIVSAYEAGLARAMVRPAENSLSGEKESD